MDEEIKRTHNSLPEEEKEQLQKYQKKGITKVTQSVDQETGEILSTETTYSSEKKRVKGTFGISSPEEIIKLARQHKTRAINTMLPYFIDNMNWNNELSFDDTFIKTYGEINKQRFFTDRKYLLDNKYIFKKPGKKNIYTLNVNLLFRGTMQKATELYEEHLLYIYYKFKEFLKLEYDDYNKIFLFKVIPSFYTRYRSPVLSLNIEAPFKLRGREVLGVVF